MQCNPAMRFGDQSRGKPALAIQRAAAVVKGGGFGSRRGQGVYKSHGSEQIQRERRSPTLIGPWP